jgi:Spy/CpxP family protein refolding chaperone
MRMIIAALVAICLANVASAQFTTGRAHGSGPGPASFQGMGKDDPVQRIAAQLSLDDGQKARLRSILEAQRSKLAEYLAEQKAAGQEPTAEQIQAVEAQLDKVSIEELRSIAYDSQLSKLDQLLQAQGGKLFDLSDGTRMRANSPNAKCDSSGKCSAVQ